MKEVVWPPSPKSAPLLGMIILNLIILIKKTFFSSEQRTESQRVRAVKRRLMLAQMTQALRWNMEDPGNAANK